MEQSNFYKKIEKMLEGDYKLLEASGYEKPTEIEKYAIYEAVLENYQGEKRRELAAACQCFYIFRKLHLLPDKQPESATLLGDYFFSRFSQCLIPIDSVKLIERFSDFLKEDSIKQTEIQGGFPKEHYIAFVKDISRQLEKTRRKSNGYGT